LCGDEKKTQTDSTRTPEDWICIATGPSLTREDCEKASRATAKVIVVNDAYRLCPDAEYLYACDDRWWRHHLEDIRANFKGELYTQYHNDSVKQYADREGLKSFPGKGSPGLGLDRIHHGGNSGYQSINLAYLLGNLGEKPGSRIILLGFDMGNTHGKKHFFGDHPKGMQNGNYSNYVPAFNQLAKDLESEGVEVVNCSRNSALTQFKRGVIDDYTDQIGGCDL